MFSIRQVAPWAALCAMLITVTQPAWGICVGCQRGARNATRTASVQRSHERVGLFSGNLFAGRAERVSHRAGASCGSSSAYEASCGSSAAEASCGAAAEDVDAADVGSGYEVDDVSFFGRPSDASQSPREFEIDVDTYTERPPSPIQWRVETVQLPPRVVRWRVHEVARVSGNSAIVAETNHHPKAVW